MVRRSLGSWLRLGAGAALVVGLAVAVPVVGAPASAAATSTVQVVYGWGSNAFGALGAGSGADDATPSSCGPAIACSRVPVQMSLPPGVVGTAVAAGGSTYVIGSDGNLYASGDNGDGQLGNGSDTGPQTCIAPLNNGTTDPCSTTPVPVELPSGVTPKAVAAGNDTGYAVGSDGKLYAWGYNGDGELGNGTTTNADTPVVVTLPTGVTAKAVAAGFSAGYAIGSDGNLYAWGDSGGGELGNGTTTGSLTPVVVPLPTGVTATAAAGGYQGGYALGSDGQVYAWGINIDGELGNGTTTSSPTPVVVSLPTGVRATAVAAGSYDGYALASDGTVYAWGSNGFGELGNGLTTAPTTCTEPASGICNLTPVPVALPTGVTASAIGAASSDGYALGSDGNVYAWGYNFIGELGDGVLGGPAICANELGPCSATPVPVPLPAGSTPLSLSASEASDGAFVILTAVPVAPTVVVQPTSDSVVAGATEVFSASAGGLPTPTVQWQVSTDGGATFTPVTGATDTSLILSDVSLADSGDVYEAVFTNASGSVTSDPATLTVTAPVAPTITQQPADQDDAVGNIATFTALATGNPTPTVQWQYSSDGGATWNDVPDNPTSNSTTLSGIIFGAFENGWEARAVFTNSAGSVTTDPATLTVVPPVAPTITQQPADQSDAPGQIATFNAAASGDPTPTVQWQYSTDGGATWADIPGNPTSTTPNPSGIIFGTFENGWQARAVFTNSAGSATTNPATLTVP